MVQVWSFYIVLGPALVSQSWVMLFAHGASLLLAKDESEVARLGVALIHPPERPFGEIVFSSIHPPVARDEHSGDDEVAGPRGEYVPEGYVAASPFFGGAQVEVL